MLGDRGPGATNFVIFLAIAVPEKNSATPATSPTATSRPAAGRDANTKHATQPTATTLTTGVVLIS